MLYTGKHFPVAVHGLKRMREVYQIRDLDLDHERVWDTRLMAHLLDPGRDDDHGYRLSALVREYLNQDYPYMGENLFAEDYPEFLHHCLEKDAELVRRFGGDLMRRRWTRTCSAFIRKSNFRSHQSLCRCTSTGSPSIRPLVGNHLAAARQQLEQLESQLDFGSRNLFSARDTYWYLHDAGVDFPEDIGRGFRIDDDDLKELAEEHGIELAAQILRWRKLTRDVRFLEAGAGADQSASCVADDSHVHRPNRGVRSAGAEHRQEEIPSSSHRPAGPHSGESGLEDLPGADSGPFEQRS